MFRHGLAVLLTASVLAFSLSACKEKVGDGCTKDKAACQDEKTALSCQGGKYIATPCSGPGGCKISGGQVSCDITGNKTGDPCSTDDEGTGQCTPDKKELVKCKAGKLVREACDGKGGCVDHTCNMRPKAGDRCNKGDAVCADAKSELTCDGGKLAKFACKGPSGCTETDKEVKCDFAGAAAGDPCSRDDEGDLACSADGKSSIECKGGKYVVTACKKGCKVEGKALTCD
jgi:hypothetical protein